MEKPPLQVPPLNRYLEGKNRVKFGQTRVPKSRPRSQPKNENGPFLMTRVALDAPLLTRVTALIIESQGDIYASLPKRPLDHE